MSDKLQKTDSAIVPASPIADKITSALKSEDKPANTGFRWPGQLDACQCGHLYGSHNYSDSLGSKTDPLGFMYECRGAGFREMKGSGLVPDGQRPVCGCKQFVFVDSAIVPPPVPSAYDLAEWAQALDGNAPVKIVTSETVCIGVPTTGPHQCPGFVMNALGSQVFCKCSCESCLTKTRIEMQRANGDSQPERGVMVSGNGASIFTNSMTCVTCGSARGEYGIRDHRSCAVVDTSTGSPIVCKCDCKDCKRLWFSDGRPVARVENGKRVILREDGSKRAFDKEERLK